MIGEIESAVANEIDMIESATGEEMRTVRLLRDRREIVAAVGVDLDRRSAEKKLLRRIHLQNMQGMVSRVSSTTTISTVRTVVMIDMVKARTGTGLSIVTATERMPGVEASRTCTVVKVKVVTVVMMNTGDDSDEERTLTVLMVQIHIK